MCIPITIGITSRFLGGYGTQETPTRGVTFWKIDEKDFQRDIKHKIYTESS